MKKRSELILAMTLIPLDFLALVLAGMSAYYIRFAEIFTEVRPITFSLPFSYYLNFLIPLSIVGVFVFALFGMYSLDRNRRIFPELSKVFVACSTGLTVLIFWFFFSRDLFSSRFILLAAWILAVLYLSFSRIVIRVLRRFLLKRGIGARNIVLVGEDKTTEILKDFIKKKPELGFRAVRVISEFSQKDSETLLKYINTKEIDELWQTDASIKDKDSLALLNIADRTHVTFKYAADFFDTHANNIEIGTLSGIPLVEIKKTPLEGWRRVYKRIFDIVFSVFALTLFSPILLAIAIAVRLESKGPAIFKNERVGRRGNFFYLYKFRRMKTEFCTGELYDKTGEAEKYRDELAKKSSFRDGPIYKIKDDPRSTKVGKWIEKTSLDELPQFWNVLIGNMSIVGPRPHQWVEVQHYIDQYPRIFDIKPGITGMAQVSGRSDLDFKEEMKLDLLYIENWSLWKDIIICIKTPLVILFKRHQS